jgi:sulfur relay (sulfurtransferase) DsrF/TusC family protein
LLSSAETPTATMLSNAKSFYSQQLTSLPKVSSTNQGGTVGSTDDRKIEEEKAPIWDEAKIEKTVDGKTVMTVPLKKHNLDNKDVEYVRKYVFEERNGDITDGKIIEVIGTPELIEEKGESTVTRYKDKQIAGFIGAVISYDLNYRYLEGHHYQNGRQVPGMARIIPKLPNTTGKGSGRGKLASAHIPNKISTEIGDDGPTQTCTNWYLVTYYYDQYGDFMYSTETYLGPTCTGGGYVGPPPVGGGSTEIVKYDCAGEPNGTASTNNPCNICMGGNTGITACAVDTAMSSKFVRDRKAMCALSKLMKDGLFKNILNNFIGTNKPIDLTFKLDSIPQEPGFQTYANTIPNPATWNSNNIDITLAENVIDNLTSLEVGLALLHEGVHAEIFRKLISIQGPSNLSNKNFPTLFNLYTQYKVNQGYTHEYMANHYVDLMASALGKFDNNKFTIDYYKAIAWFGLKGTAAYDNLSATIKSEITAKGAALLLNRSKTDCDD